MCKGERREREFSLCFRTCLLWCRNLRRSFYAAAEWWTTAFDFTGLASDVQMSSGLYKILRAPLFCFDLLMFVADLCCSRYCDFVCCLEIVVLLAFGCTV